MSKAWGRTRLVKVRTQQITEIDKMIDQIHGMLMQREAIDLMDCESWQSAWDKHPELREIEHALYRAREDLMRS